MSRPHDIVDPREMRKIIDRARYRGERIDGKDAGRGFSATASLARNCLTAAQVSGFSGEDAMTLLAYHALLMLEQCNDRLLEFHNLDLSVRPRIFVDPSKLQTSGQDRPAQG